MKKFLLIFSIICMILCLVGCANVADHFDNIRINIKDGYFYESHKKFTVDEDTIGVTIYFSTDKEDEWNQGENDVN